MIYLIVTLPLLIYALYLCHKIYLKNKQIESYKEIINSYEREIKLRKLAHILKNPSPDDLNNIWQAGYDKGYYEGNSDKLTLKRN